MLRIERPEGGEMPIDPQEDPPIKPGKPSEPPQESPPGNPQPEVPPPMQELQMCRGASPILIHAHQICRQETV
jgi:hypothetical protein